MKNKVLIVLLIINILLLSGCGPKIDKIDGYKEKKVVKLRYQIPKEYKDTISKRDLIRSEIDVDKSSVDNKYKTKAVIVVASSNKKDYKDIKDFLYDISINIDGINKNKLYLDKVKYINKVKWSTGYNYMFYSNGKKSVTREQVNVAVVEYKGKYYGLLYATPNIYAGRNGKYQHPRFKEELDKILSSLVLS